MEFYINGAVALIPIGYNKWTDGGIGDPSRLSRSV